MLAVAIAYGVRQKMPTSEKLTDGLQVQESSDLQLAKNDRATNAPERDVAADAPERDLTANNLEGRVSTTCRLLLRITADMLTPFSETPEMLLKFLARQTSHAHLDHSLVCREKQA